MIRFFSLIILISCISCSRLLDQYHENLQISSYTSPFMGKWKGVYSGDINGLLEIDITKEGYVLGKINSENLSGIIMESGYMLNTKTSSNFILEGNLNSKNGIWKQQNLKGTWSLTKQ